MNLGCASTMLNGPCSEDRSQGSHADDGERVVEGRRRRGDEEDGGEGGVGSISPLCPLLSPLATTNHSAFPRGDGGPARPPDCLPAGPESVTRHQEG